MHDSIHCIKNCYYILCGVFCYIKELKYVWMYPFIKFEFKKSIQNLSSMTIYGPRFLSI